MSSQVNADATQVVSIGNGYFNVGGKTVNISQMMRMVGWTRIDSLDGLSAAKATLMEQISQQINALKELYMHAETAKNNKGDDYDDNSTASSAKFSLPGYDGEKNFLEWCDYFGISEVDVNPSKDDTDTWKQEWDTNAQSVNDAIDSLKTASEKLYTEAKDLNDQREDKISEMKMYMDQYHQNTSKLLQ